MNQRMNQQQGNQKKRPNPYIVGDNVLETVRGIGTNIGKTVASDVVSQVAHDALQDIINGRSNPTPRESPLSPNESIQFGKPQEQARPAFSRPDVMHPLLQKDIAETKQKLESIRQELHALSKSMHGLSQDIQTAVMEIPVEPGVYHLNFFEQLKIMLKMIRERVDDSRSWLAAWKGNAKKKRGYWGMYKKHGTTFGLSNERSLATQAG